MGAAKEITEQGSDLSRVAGETFREAFERLLACCVADEGQRETLEAMGVEPTYINQIAFSSMKKAAGGDTAAARFIRDTIGEKPEGDGGERGGGLYLDLSKLSDEQLRAIAAGCGEEQTREGWGYDGQG